MVHYTRGVEHDGVDSAQAPGDAAAGRAGSNREVPYAVQLANIVGGLAVGIAGVIIAVLKA